MVKIKGKIIKFGKSYALTIRKALVDAEIIHLGQYVELDLNEPQNIKGSDQPQPEKMPPLLTLVRVYNRFTDSIQKEAEA